MAREHNYAATITWTGNQGSGTSGYRAYSRNHDIAVAGKPVIAGSSDPAFRGDPTRHNPEDLLIGSVSACHMLWYLHLCSAAGIVVTAYEDPASGTMSEAPDGSGRFVEIVLRPQVTLSHGDPAEAESLHHKAHELCFIANSVNFPIRIEPSVVIP